MERGNTDLIIFILMFFSVFSSTWVQLFFIQVGVALKLFPIFSLITLLRYPREMILGITASSLIFYLYKDQLALILANTQTSYVLSYGTTIITNGLATKFHLEINKWFLNFTLLTAAVYFFLKEKHFIHYNSISNQGIRMCLVGASIYSGTFFFASNWDYRLIFLNLCLPLISELKKRYLKNLLFGILFLACNQLLLYFLFGAVGAIINTLMKVCCLIFCLIFLLNYITYSLGLFLNKSGMMLKE